MNTFNGNITLWRDALLHVQDNGRAGARPSRGKSFHGVNTSQNKQSFGFSFIEVLVALLILSILSASVSYSLITALQVEQQASLLQTTRYAAQTLSMAYYTETDPNITKDLLLNNYDVLTTTRAMETPSVEWVVWSLYPAVRPSLLVEQYYSAYRAGKE